MKNIALGTVTIILFGCASHNSDYTTTEGRSYYVGGDGATFAQAVAFPYVKKGIDGEILERKWLTEQYPGFSNRGQDIVNHQGKIYNRVEVITHNGEEKIFYFDVTSWFGFPAPYR